LVTAVTNRWYGLVKRVARAQKRGELDAVYTQRYFSAESDMTVPTAGAVVDELLKAFNPRTLLDVGCGTGVYIREFRARGISALGVEGSSHAIASAVCEAGAITQHDLRQPLHLEKRFDLVVCFEVAEHLPAAFAGVLAQSILRHGRDVAFSAAQPGQGGVDHINEQTSEYWIACFTQQGAVFDRDATDALRRAFRDREVVWWLPRNVLVFKAPVA
jgi:2-polyprenyl-3-methyl-5-hydroxy-6-metoxy-1,4-benzoquinol methylase